MMTIKNKTRIKYLIITIIILMYPIYSYAAPDINEVKHWLDGKEIVVGKTLWIFNSTEKIRPEKITSIKIVDYKEPFSINPFTNNRGNLMVEFNYASKKGNIQCTASIMYEWEMGWSGKTRYFKNIIIHTKGA
ncbi:MAG: hypothetical protein N3D15_06110 [Syntrophorhabdaceae bacterium]|nr:hypothetical protein [Syntrophorhabdaceae bacterium]